MQVIDSHAHIFPPLETAPGFPSADDHRAGLQWGVRQHVQPVLTREDGREVRRQTLVTEPIKGKSSLTNVRFRVGRFGRLEWDVDGTGMYLQYMPPMLAHMEAPAELMVALMDHAGVDRAVLQNDSLYGRLNPAFAAAVAQWPERFISLAHIDLLQDRAHEDDLAALITEQGHSGLFVKLDDFFEDDFATTPFSDRYRPLWEYVATLGMPVYWQLVGFPVNSRAAYFRTWRLFGEWLQEYGDVPVVIVGGLPVSLASHARLPQMIQKLVTEHRVMLEVAFPIQVGAKYRYPFRECADALRFLYETFGPTKLVWASDIPNVERYCTYRQSYGYLEEFSFLDSNDRARITGGNVAELFGIARRHPADDPDIRPAGTR